MIREGKKLPPDIETKIPEIIAKIADDNDVVALYAFGSLAEGNLKPLSDLDFAVLLSDSLDPEKRFDKHLHLIGVFNDTFRTDEVDLVILNDDPLRFAYHVLKTGDLLHCNDKNELIDFREKTVKRYLDFKPFRDRFVNTFLEGIGYRG